MIKKLLWIFPFLFSLTANSQIKLKSAVCFNYSYGLPSGDLHSFISDKAFDGADFQYRHFIQRNFSLGFRLGWNNFKTVLPRNVYETDKGTVSAIQSRYFYSMPLLITGYYYLRSSHYVMPYIGGGAGGYILNYEKYFGVVKSKDNSFNMGFSPEAGVILPFKNSGVGLIINGKYNHVFYSHNEIMNLNYFEASIGVYVGYPVFEDPMQTK